MSKDLMDLIRHFSQRIDYFLEEPPCCFPQCLHQFTFPPTINAQGFPFLHIHNQHLLTFVFRYLNSERLYIIVGWFCISLVISYNEHFHYLLAICMSSLEKYLLRSFVPFFFVILETLLKFIYSIQGSKTFFFKVLYCKYIKFC